MNSILNRPAEKWVAALRSGEYKQGIGCLQSEDGFCCLGVACDVFAKETGVGKWVKCPDGAFVFKITRKSEDIRLPDEVAAWLNMKTHIGALSMNVCESLDGCECCSLADLNDHGKSFAEIADAIEKYKDDLFVSEKSELGQLMKPDK